jgi:hypothetical protein
MLVQKLHDQLIIPYVSVLFISLKFKYAVTKMNFVYLSCMVTQGWKNYRHIFISFVSTTVLMFGINIVVMPDKEHEF